MKYGYLRCACAVPELKVADTEFNTKKIIEIIEQADKENVRLLVFPELAVTGYTCGDLFLQSSLLKGALDSIEKICDATKNSDLLCAVGFPFRKDGALYNCAAFIYQGSLIAVIPKTYIPNYGEFYEKRWFTAFTSDAVEYTDIASFESVPFGTSILIQDENDSRIKFAAEICEDVWVPLSPSTKHALNGATVIANLSAGNEVALKAEYRRSLIAMQSAKNICTYVYANAGHDESTTDMIFSGHSLIAANGSIAAERQPFENQKNLLIADVDIEKIDSERSRTVTFADTAKKEKSDSYVTLFISLEENNLELSQKEETPDFYAAIPCHPFVPESQTERKIRCQSIIELQSEGLAKRLRHINARSAVIGLSGGLDSTLALLVTARAFDKCGIDRKQITCITMPCFGTTDRTYKNACILAEKTGAELKEIDIKDSVLLHFEQIGQDKDKHDVTYENGQARMRTLILMNYANKCGGIVIGTGDLSELALGWCTYNGDHMSMYGVNSSIPKTLVRYLVSWFADEADSKNNKELHDVLTDILATPVSPELIPPDKDGKISQKTEELVGPYELHDFFLYYVLRYGFTPSKIYFLACQALLGKKAEGTDTVYTKEIIKKWLVNFYRRFFSQQFKRSCMPDGAKVGTVNLSPRGDWRMPSDASAAIWLKEAEEC
ncbi:NAD(+) synthase [Treponema sp.]|uniref:NAD(+) synthase n=1 Tax=Treponema sp. TaxID=166 RepID=UPI0025D3B911|nr:NAD(+) synthase [Treponema sp.]MCR5218817.1 NAD(+) synthase [Treponema sp.]